jgi:hypothetical protein
VGYEEATMSIRRATDEDVNPLDGIDLLHGNYKLCWPITLPPFVIVDGVRYDWTPDDNFWGDWWGGSYVDMSGSDEASGATLADLTGGDDE